MLTYAEVIQMPLDDVRQLNKQNPGNKAVGNALRELERKAKAQKKLKRMGRKSATVNGMTKNRFSHSGPRVPTKKELK